MNPTAAIAAGAAAAAARDNGADELGQLQQGTLAALVVEKKEQDEKDALEKSPATDASSRTSHHGKQSEEDWKQPGEGWMRKLMHWLNIR